MIQYSCDRCKRRLDPQEDLRYVVKVEVSAFMDPLESDEMDDDCDHLLEVQEIIECSEDEESDQIGDDIYRRLRFDLCSDCYKRYLLNPVGREPVEHFGFSEN